MKQFFTNVIGFMIKNKLAILLVVSVIYMFFLLFKYETKPVKNKLAVDYTKQASDMILFKDSLIREYVKINSKKDSLQNLIKVLQKDNKALSLQMSLLKFKQSKILTNEKNITYLSDNNVTVDSALNVINRIVTKYPIKVRNR